VKKTASENRKVKRPIIFNGFKGEIEVGENETKYKSVLHTLYAVNPTGLNFKTIDIELIFNLDDQGTFQLEKTKLKEV
jgi:hypothetical protein